MGTETVVSSAQAYQGSIDGAGSVDRCDCLCGECGFIARSRDGIAVIDALGTVVAWNRAQEAITGRPANEAVGQPLWDIQFESAPAAKKTHEGYVRLRDFIEGILGSQQLPDLQGHSERVVVRPDGSQRVVSSAIFPFKREGDFFIGSITRDLTAIRNAQQASGQLAAVVEASADAIVGTDADGNVITWNKGAERMYGYTASEVVGKPAPIILLPDAWTGLTSGGSQGAQREAPVHWEMEHVRKDGVAVYVALSTAPIRDAEGRVVGTTTVARDVGERRRAEERLAFLGRLRATSSAINRLIVREADRWRLLSEACRVLVEVAGLRAAWVGMVNQATGEVVPVAKAGCKGIEHLQPRPRLDDSPLGKGPTGTAIRTGQTVVFADLASRPELAAWQEYVEAIGYLGAAAFPLRVGGRVVGALGVFASDLTTFTGEVVDLL
ncbi:MAG: PAS domain S-box protein, partial [Chloroflexota bacterium]